MRAFAKSILNYFAAYTETRFRFSRKLPFEWTEDALTLDMSVFPAFQEIALDQIARGTVLHLEVGPGQYTVAMDKKVARRRLDDLMETELTLSFLEQCAVDAAKQIQDASVENGEKDSRANENQILTEGCRAFNLFLRRRVVEVFTEVHDQQLADMRERLGFEQVPPSSFNPRRELQGLYEKLQQMARRSKSLEDYHRYASGLLADMPLDFILYDLYAVIRRYAQPIGTHSLYLFFHQISREDQRYPLFTIEVELDDRDQKLTIRAARDGVMLNTPAVNNFEFDSVLTTPRAARFADAGTEIGVIQSFLQAHYAVTEAFLLQPHFRPLVYEGLPTVRYRIGFQAIKEENRRILDYSELITNLDTGAGKTFIELVNNYVDGNVENTAAVVHEEYLKRFGQKSVERLVPASWLVPLPLNETQKRILVATENPKNKMMVVDGPPGTGKSHTITALVYAANQAGKSVVVTSHKRQALDVIDQALISQFKRLHPQAKPNVLRLEKDRGPRSLNDIDNTLSTQVINAARNRFHHANAEAVEKDRRRLHDQLDASLQRYWKDVGNSGRCTEQVFEWLELGRALLGDRHDEIAANLPRRPEGTEIDSNRIARTLRSLEGASAEFTLDALSSLAEKREDLPDALERCERLHRMALALAPDTRRIDSVPAELAGFAGHVQRLRPHLETNVPLGRMDIARLRLDGGPPVDDLGLTSFDLAKALQAALEDLVALQGRFLGKLFKAKEIRSSIARIRQISPHAAEALQSMAATELRNRIAGQIQATENAYQDVGFLKRDYLFAGHRQTPPAQLAKTLETLGTLKFRPAVEAIETVYDRPLSELTLDEIAEALDRLENLGQYLEIRRTLASLAAALGVTLDDPADFYHRLKTAAAVVQKLDNESIEDLQRLFEHYGPVMAALGAGGRDLASLGRLACDPPRLETLIHYVELHGALSRNGLVSPPSLNLVEEFRRKTRKLLDAENDRRLSGLLSHAADVQRTRTAIAAGRRISAEQARTLLSHVGCIISEPELLSRHLPMEADLIDLLIIDEASQVSIADSISLMLRSRQTIVFGDELQYGAVGALNVSERYASHYFKEILRSYARDRSQEISDGEADRLADEATRNVEEDEEAACALFPVQPGQREWLKTFSIRTSTLAFAKALCNFSDSLNVHFRSFPEIISYSSEVFYRPSQIELVVNRIRTKPICDVLRFLPVQSQGFAGRNVNLDEIEAIQKDIEVLVGNGYKGSIGVICSFREQKARMEDMLRREMTLYPQLVRDHRFSIWFVGDVQGEERDLIYYSFVQAKSIENADLKTIYPAIGGTADDIRKLKMQRLNVGFSRAKDSMVFVHSMPVGDYADTRLGDALRHYEEVLGAARDHYISDESLFGSPAEKMLYGLIVQTPFFQRHRDRLRLIAQFEIGKYIREEFHRHIPAYRVDFLMTVSDGGKDRSLIIEYDGIEFHTRNPEAVTRYNIDQEYLEYDAERRLELESYGYRFLRIHKFSLLPAPGLNTPVAVLNSLLEERFNDLS